MELHEAGVTFVQHSGCVSAQWPCRVLLLNFKRLLSSPEEYKKLQTLTNFSASDLFHGTAAVCSVCLPDMEVAAIYNSLTAHGCTTALVLTTPQAVLDHRKKYGVASTPGARVAIARDYTTSKKDDSLDGLDVSYDSNSFAAIMSEGESSSEGEAEEEDKDTHSRARERFIQEAKERQSFDQHTLESVGAEHCVLGCVTFLRLSSKTESRVAQLTLLAVRKKNRRMGIGRYLMQLSKDPAVVGRYNALLAFADHKAEGFFTRHGFSDDPMLTAKYRAMADHWENSTLMVYMPPFSDAGLAIGSIKSLTHFQDHYQKWRDEAISGYCIQLGMMERLKHELLLLHSKIQSQDELIVELNRQLREARQEKALLQDEFSQYRKHSQCLLKEAALSQTEDWIDKANSFK